MEKVKTCPKCGAVLNTTRMNEHLKYDHGAVAPVKAVKAKPGKRK